MLHRKNFVTNHSTKSIYDNPIPKYIVDPDDLIDGENFCIDVEAKRIYINGYASAQAVYSKVHWLWYNDRNLSKEDFPFVAITPEQFEEIDGWSLNHYDVLTGGFSKMTRQGKVISSKASIIILSEEGRIFSGEPSSGTAIPNAGTVKLTDGEPKGYFYQKSATSEVIPLTEHMRNCLGVSVVKAMCYRIP